MEEWRDVVGYEGLYAVSNLGRVRRIKLATKMSTEDVKRAAKMRADGMIFREIATHFGVTKHAIIVALTYRPKRRAHRETNRIIKICYSSAGYSAVTLCRDGVRKMRGIHLLVTRAFYGEPPEGYQVNHKDGNKKNPRLTNLEYVTPSQNSLHSVHVLGNDPTPNLPGRK